MGFGLGGSHVASVPQFPQMMMWIYGARLRTWGMASMYNSSALVAFIVVMVVIIQYYLDVLGFFR